MISLSRLFKSQNSILAPQEQKIISIRSFQRAAENDTSQEMIQINTMQQAILEKAEQEAAMIFNEASIKAQSIQAKILQEREDWEQEKQQLAEAAKQQGFQEGFATGKDQGYQEWQAQIQEAKTIIDSSKIEYMKQITAAEKTILHLGMKVAEKILGDRIVEDEEVLLPYVKRALREVRQYREIQLHVNSSNYNFILSRKEELMAVFPKETELYIYPDEALSVGNCVIESESGRIDATINTQLQEIKAKLLAILESEPDGSK